MPSHSLANSSHPFDEDAYLKQLLSIRGRFDVVVACISPPCVRNGNWIRSFERSGIPWIEGADSVDRNALRRMAAILGSFEHMTTNTLGSHIAYAAYSGCRVSIWGPYFQYRLEDFKGVPWYERHWTKLMGVFEQLSESRVRSRFEWLFKDPWEASLAHDWAQTILGLPHKREANEVARLLGWTPLGQAEALLHRAARRGAAVTGRIFHVARHGLVGSRDA